ncbi:signal peptidase complex catalytic subunit SEC11A-like isoform X2 [Phoenix dactylifera]|uniref:Signal peptidase complex catalytic subunit SEC11 n=1 Tax=Phoenix dactylifera TaxID=42345 RepID=A0A8B8J455_PHODC|nr:signal peptidase complex catalytic subunit SEC11A-like isoform X2 [Phoenix dactylifera]
MGWIGGNLESIRSLQTKQALTQAVNLGLVVTSALILWRGLMCVTGTESPVVVVLSGSMEPGFQRGDILFLHMNQDPIRAGEIVVFNVDGKDIPIVHRVIEVHERQDTGEVDVLTKVNSYIYGFEHQEIIMKKMIGFFILTVSFGFRSIISQGEL